MTGSREPGTLLLMPDESRTTFRIGFGKFIATAAASTTMLAAAWPASASGAPADEDSATIIVDASRFLDRFPREHRITHAAALDVPWLFNNFAVDIRNRHNLLAEVDVPEPGDYHLYVRSRGGRFRVAVDDRVVDENLEHDAFRLRRVGTFSLEAGSAMVRIMGIDGSPTIDVIVLAKEAGLTDDNLKNRELPEEVRLLRDYQVPRTGTVKFGDLTGDGRMDFLVVRRDFSAHAFDHEGNRLWSYTAPEEHADRRVHEPPGLVWDLDGDGRAEAVHWRMIDGVEWLVVADGRTGEIVRKTEWPTRPLPHDYSNFRLAIGQLRSERPDTILVFTDSGIYSERDADIRITAYDAALDRLWEHREDKLKDHLGHYVYARDLTGDGRDEVVVSGLILDADGNEILNRFDFFFRNQEHMDSIRFADLTENGRLEIVAPSSDTGVTVFDSRTGDLIWQHTAEHAQQAETGTFLDGVEGLQVAVGARTYNPLASYVWWFTADGQLLKKWPPNPLNGNPMFVKGDWYGDGTESLFWYKFRLNREGKGALYFKEPVYHMFDFTGDGAEEVITLQGSTLRVYGYKHADPDGEAKRSVDYLKDSVANHTHY